ncbi:hypothetical protein F5148DRAFT_1153190 [Russula earlei]|uniref:Uncharacterized protein n=1 Tax=Russula earlei TaxID=71964 RepID=A0ACC0TV58_9AGAM|nr:hypothetical protein F5148DRAFT_1153190 [Russula earlei]
MAVICPSMLPQTEQGSHTHTSTPQKAALQRYKDMTWDIHDKFIQAIKVPGLVDNLTFINTTVKQDKAIQGRPDIVIFGKTTGQLLQWDHSGAIYTKLFNQAKDPNTISENDEGVGAAQSMLAVYKGVKKVEVEDLHQTLVNDDHATDGQPKPYITLMPIWETKTLFGWSFFGYVCHDIKWNELVYLKDYWHTNFPGIEKEGDIYRDLRKAKVHYILKLGPAGNMLLTPEHPLNIQSTRTQDYVKDGNCKHTWCPSTPHVK